jgi:hypothetical protein
MKSSGIDSLGIAIVKSFSIFLLKKKTEKFLGFAQNTFCDNNNNNNSSDIRACSILHSLPSAYVRPPIFF